MTKRIQTIMDFDSLIPVMTPDELDTFKEILAGQHDAAFSHDTLASMKRRANEREKEINDIFNAAMAKSYELCRQRTARK